MTPSATHLTTARKHLNSIRKDIPKLSALGEKMARCLLAGGNIFTPPIAKWWPSEFCHRAGGMMGIRAGNYVPTSRNDLAYFTFPDPRRYDPAKDEALKTLMKSRAQLVAIADPAEVPANMRKRFLGFTGGTTSTEGAFAFESLKPLTNFRTLEQFVRGWTTAGEMITACIRGGKMPTMWMSVWLEGALARNSAFTVHDNRREPWYTPVFHPTQYIPPLAPGYAANAFLDELEKIHTRLEEQSASLATAGKWMAAAHRAGKKIHAVAVGHSHPEILELSHTPNFPIRWAGSVSDLNKAVPMDVAKGDVAIHLGYSPVDLADVKKILDRGVKFIYTTPYGRPATLRNHPNMLWLDLPWRPTDATVDIPAYSVRMLPMSSSSHALAYNAMLAEFAAAMGWNG